jgi:hypothetical protein
MKYVTLILCLLMVPAPSYGAGKDPLAIVRAFLPPRSELAQLYSFDYKVGRVRRRWPAVLPAHVMGPTSEDIVFAYYSPRVNTVEKTLFVTLLHHVPGGYEKIYEKSYRSQVLVAPDSLRICHLQGESADALAVMAGMGASIGGHLDILVWRGISGWVNIFPPNSGVHYFYFFPTPHRLAVALSRARHPGPDGKPSPEPPPARFEWNGHRFTASGGPR